MPLWLALLLGWIVGAAIVGAVLAACLAVITRDTPPPPKNGESPAHRRGSDL